MAEENIYVDNYVSVKTARIIISGTTYALRNITSVRMTVTPADQRAATVLIIIGVIGLLGSVAAFGNDVGCGVVVLLGGGAMVAGGIIAALKAKPSYDVTIASSAGEIRALTSKNKDYISKIVAAINEAFVRYR